MNIEDIFEEFFEKYFTVFTDMERIPVRIILSDDFQKTYCELRPDKKAHIIAQNPKYINKYNGLTVVPSNVDNEIYILLNTKMILKYTEDGSYTWIGTFAHELTHAIDFYQIVKRDNLSPYEILEDYDSIYLMIKFWSEYHARKFGYKFLRIILEIDNDETYPYEERLKHILTTEWPTHKQMHYENYHNNINGHDQIYETMQLLGRYSAWCDLFPNDFDEDSFNIEFDGIDWIQNLFLFLRTHESLDEIRPNLYEMKKVLQENWPID